MKDYLSKYISMRAGSAAANTKGDDLTELTKPGLKIERRSSVSFVSDSPLECVGIDEDVAWRVEAMLPQIPDSGPIPFLVARQTEERRSDCCHSCGDSLGGGPGYVCGLCSTAKAQAIEIAMRNSPLTSGDLKKV